MSILLRYAAKHYKGLPHQDHAWNELQKLLSPSHLEAFARLYRAAPKNKLDAAACEKIFLRPINPQQLVDLHICLIRFEIDKTNARLCHFLAQIGHESGGLRWLIELASGEDYEWRSDLGNTQAGDGRRFKGAGAIQLTGRVNYQAFANAMKDPKVMEGAEYVSQKYPFTAAGFWWDKNQMNAFVDSGASCRRVSAKVNGKDPANGLADREAYYSRARALFPFAPA